MVLSADHQQMLLQEYLGYFAVPAATEAERNTLIALMPSQLCSGVFIHSDTLMLRKFGCRFLIHFGHQYHKTLSTYDLVDRYFQQSEIYEESTPAFYEVDAKLLILFHTLTQPSNKKLPELVVHTFSQRFMKGKYTLLLTQRSLPELRGVVRAHKDTFYQEGLSRVK